MALLWSTNVRCSASHKIPYVEKRITTLVGECDIYAGLLARTFLLDVNTPLAQLLAALDSLAEEADLSPEGEVEGGAAGQEERPVHSWYGQGAGYSQAHGKEVHRRRESAHEATTAARI